MTDLDPHPQETVLDYGGLRFGVSFRGPGATLRVNGDDNGESTELLRFDDFIEQPHYHVPASADAIMFDRGTLVEPLAWYIGQIRDNLGELLTTAGYGDVVPTIDLKAVSKHAGDIEKAMEDCVPEGYVRVAGVGLQKADA